MADKKEVGEALKGVKQKVPEKAEPTLLPQRIHIKEFIMVHAPYLDEMQKSGLRALARGKEWMSKDEWQAILNRYVGKK